METIPKSDREPREPPDECPDGDVREPPLSGEGREDFPGDSDLIEPGEGGGRTQKRLST